MPLFSIIIISRQNNNYLAEAIAALRNQSFKDFEVIIVLDIKDSINFDNDERFKVFVSDDKSPGGKRNYGSKKALGKILVFMDDDAFPTKNWLAEAATIFEKEDVFALGGPALTPQDVEFQEKLSGRVIESWMTSGSTSFRHKISCSRQVFDYPSVNLFVTKEAFDGVGGFSTKFWPGEDTKLCLDLVKRYKKNFKYDPRPVVYHHRRFILLPYLKQVSRYGMHRGRFARIFPETSLLPMYFIPSLFVLSLALSPLFILFNPILKNIYFFALAIYLLLILIETAKMIVKEKDIKYLLGGFVIFATHIVYGSFFLKGLFQQTRLQLRRVDESTGNYLGG